MQHLRADPFLHIAYEAVMFPVNKLGYNDKNLAWE